MLFSKVAATVAFCAGTSVALVSNGSPFIAYVCPPGPASDPYVYRNAASIRGVQTKCGYVAKDNTNPPRHGVLVNQCPETLPDTPECTWYAFDQTFNIPANGAPFVFYATKKKEDFDATAVRCKQAGCKWVSRASKVKKPDTFGILCNMCDRSPELTPGADSYGFGNQPPPAPVKHVTVTSTRTVNGNNVNTIYKTVFVDDVATATLTEYKTLPKQTVTSTITVGNNPKTVCVVEYVGNKPSRTITRWILDPTPIGAPTTVTKTIRKGGQAETVYIVYVGGRAVRTSRAPAAETSTVTRYITQNGRRVKTIYVQYGGGTTKTITYTKDPMPTDDSQDGDDGGQDGDDGGQDGDDGGQYGDNGGQDGDNAGGY